MQLEDNVDINVNKKDFVEIIRDAFVTKADAEEIYEKIHDRVLTALLQGGDVNLFGCVKLTSFTKPGYVLKNTIGTDQENYFVPERKRLKARVYPKLQRGWDDRLSADAGE